MDTVHQTEMQYQSVEIEKIHAILKGLYALVAIGTIAVCILTIVVVRFLVGIETAANTVLGG